MRTNKPLRELRKRAGLTQIEVAERMEVLQGAVSHWEQGLHLPTARNREKLAKLYGCTVEELLAAIKNTQP